MTVQTREKFATQIDTDLLSAVRGIARDEGRQIQVIVEEALRDFIDRRNRSHPRAHVMAAYRTSLETFAPLYKKLAE